MMNYLVTGGAGFIGANFIKYLRKLSPHINITVLDALTYAGNLTTIEDILPQINFIKGSINSYPLVSKILMDNNINIIIHFAAESHVDRSIDNPQIFLETNILGTQNLLECAKEFWQIGTDKAGYPIYKEGVKFIQVSTDEVYGTLSCDFEGPKKLHFPDNLKALVKNRSGITTYGSDFFTENTPLSPHSPYSASKASADMIVKSYGDTYKFPYNITRCSNNYGPYHFPEKLIPLIIKNLIEGKDIPVYGQGLNVRDWLYVEDHCKGIAMVVDKGRLGEVYNIGGFNEAQNINIVRMIIQIMQDLITNNPQYKTFIKHNRPFDESFITYVQDRLGHDARYAIDPTKIVTELGWYPETTFEEGLTKTIHWYLENQDWVQNVVSGDYIEFYNKYYN
ncbi:MAG: dTDP-glucose 4,6-dehydratase [Brevinema sp.]